MSTYRIRSPILGIEQTLSGMKIVRFEAGALLDVPEAKIDLKFNRRLGTIGIVFRGHNVSVFMEDLDEYAERLGEETSRKLV